MSLNRDMEQATSPAEALRAFLSPTSTIIADAESLPDPDGIYNAVILGSDTMWSASACWWRTTDLPWDEVLPDDRIWNTFFAADSGTLYATSRAELADEIIRECHDLTLMRGRAVWQTALAVLIDTCPPEETDALDAVLTLAALSGTWKPHHHPNA